MIEIRQEVALDATKDKNFALVLSTIERLIMKRIGYLIQEAQIT